MYVRDVCTRCGENIERQRGHHEATAKDAPSSSKTFDGMSAPEAA